MKKIGQLFTISVFWLFSCHSSSTENKDHDTIVSLTQKQPLVFSLHKSNRTDTAETLLIDDRFIADVLDSDLTLKKLKEVYKPFNTNQKIVRNVHDETQQDTIIIFGQGVDSIYLFKGNNKEIVLKATCTNKGLLLDKNIRIGVGKDFFKKKFNRRALSDVVKVQDLEGGNVFTFTFKDNQLNKIAFSANYVD